ncbi:MAG: hypothetical protein K8S99_08995 [Planctomycetes bacterium]|nr:hypothetical protein [Planctomycetota bacterium]
MAFEIDTRIPWTEHFVQHGFAVLRNQVSREFTDAALRQIRQRLEAPARDLPFEEWTVDNIKWTDKPGPGDPVLDRLYDEPNIRHIIDTMYGTPEVGSPTGWSGEKTYQVFLTPFSPDYKPTRLEGGHLDFGGHLIPKFGNAFVMQVALRDTEPFGGNITIIPGSHKLVQQRVIANPFTQYPSDFDLPDLGCGEPYEFVAKAGDVLLMQHLSFHNGNKCGGATRRPRIALHVQVPRTTFPTIADPADAGSPPWVRSFTLNGRHEDPDDERRYMEFGESKKRMWGEWTSADEPMYFKIYTWADNSLRARIRLAGVPEQISHGARFDGRLLTFGCDANAPTSTNCRVVLEVDPKNSEQMIGTITPESAAPGEAPRTFLLRRTGIITTRLNGEA